MKGTFREILHYYGAHDLEFDAVIGGVDMDFTYSFNGVLKFSKYCEEKYGKLLDSQAEVKYDERGIHTDCVIVDYEDEEKGDEFSRAVAGWCSEKEYERLFEEYKYSRNNY